ncbi:MAG: DUF2149 domain-containing protein [Gammaproteobacteria bacterium]|nr:DUF2149 domain-containing protein [Gammaproteobacteria bacterium]
MQESEDLDPLSSLVNLFDVAMVFSVALMAALVSYLDLGEMLFSDEFTLVKNPGEQDMEIVIKQGQEIRAYQADETQQATGERGRPIGTAYQLESGEIIYIPN